MIDIKKMGMAAKAASLKMALASSGLKNASLEAIAEGLRTQSDRIMQANQKDIDCAKKAGLDAAILERLSLQGKLEGIIADISQVIKLKDPVGDYFDNQQLSNHLAVSKCRTPIGVLGVIYESRPNVTIDISVLAIKSGNCAILRGGSETLCTNKALGEIICQALVRSQLPTDAIQVVHDADRSHVKELLQMHDTVDLIIPRGGTALHRYCRENSMIPVITGGIGICHLFVDASADLEKAQRVIMNAKTQRPTVCNALDTLLVHKEIADKFIPRMLSILREAGVQLKMDEKSWDLVQPVVDNGISLAEEKDWDTEWLSLVLGIKVVKDLAEAIQHIHTHSTGHSDGILTANQENADAFIRTVDSAAVYVNASTRFTDGGQLGLGAEVAISTQKLHARGPMGLQELTTYKWVVKGDYSVRA